MIENTHKKSVENQHTEMLFNKKNYVLMIAGVVLMALGYVLMSGGAMPSPEVWDDNIIYSSRRTLIAPILILAGIAVEIYAIFKK